MGAPFAQLELRPGYIGLAIDVRDAVELAKRKRVTTPDVEMASLGSNAEAGHPVE